VIAGTVFQDTKLPLTVWFRGMWHVTSQKNGMSALGLQRVLGLGSYRSAWLMLHKLRKAMVRPGRDRLKGIIIEQAIEPGSTIVTDGWSGYSGLTGYQHERIFQSGNRKPGGTDENLLPRVHRVASLLKRWLMGTHQGGVQDKHMDDYLNEFTFRFNRRTSKSRGLLFYRLVEQAVQIEPTTYKILVEHNG